MVKSHCNLTSDEISTLKANIDTLTLDQKRGMIPIVKEYANTKHGPNQFSLNLDELSGDCLARLNEYVYSNVTSNNRKQKRRENDKKKRDLKAQ